MQCRFLDVTQGAAETAVAGLSGQLSGLGEGIGLLIKEIRDLKAQQAVANNNGGGANALLMAATIGKALQAIKQAQSAVTMSSVGVPVATAPISGTALAGAGGMGMALGNPALAGMLGTSAVAGNLAAQGAGVGGAVGSTTLAAMLNQAMASAMGHSSAGFHKPIGLPPNPLNPFAPSLVTSINSMGVKNAANFINSLSNGLNRVTEKYMKELKATGALKLPPVSKSSKKINFRKRSHDRKSKRAQVITIDKAELEQILRESDEKGLQFGSNKISVPITKVTSPAGSVAVPASKPNEIITKITKPAHKVTVPPSRFSERFNEAIDKNDISDHESEPSKKEILNVLTQNYEGILKKISSGRPTLRELLEATKYDTNGTLGEENNKNEENTKDVNHEELINNFLVEKAHNVKFGYGLKPSMY